MMKKQKDYTDDIRKILMDRLDTIGYEDTLDMLSVEYTIVQLNDFINQILKPNKSKTINHNKTTKEFCDHHWLPVGIWDGTTFEQCTKCNLYKEQNS